MHDLGLRDFNDLQLGGVTLCDTSQLRRHAYNLHFEFVGMPTNPFVSFGGVAAYHLCGAIF